MIRFYYCPILGLRWIDIEGIPKGRFNRKRKKNRRNDARYIQSNS